jgi:hypothetical protein
MKPMSHQQSLALVNSQQLYEGYVAATWHAAEYRYGMRWKTVSGRDYLFRERDRRGNGRSLGPRGPETERTLAEFHAAKSRGADRLSGLTEALREQARMNVALRINRAPRFVGRLLRELKERRLDDAFTVLGTQALYGYEALAGGQFLTELLASGDIDLLYDHRKNLTLVAEKLDGTGLLGLLRELDRSFEPVQAGGFRAMNRDSFMVDFIVAPRGMLSADPVRFAADDLTASEVPGLQWLLNAPKIEALCVDATGWPTPMRLPDPRAFALHKAWLARQKNRESLKRDRDLAQARALAEAIDARLPQFSFDDMLTALHGDVRAWLPWLRSGME